MTMLPVLLKKIFYETLFCTKMYLLKDLYIKYIIFNVESFGYTFDYSHLGIEKHKKDFAAVHSEGSVHSLAKKVLENLEPVRGTRLFSYRNSTLFFTGCQCEDTWCYRKNVCDVCYRIHFFGVQFLVL